MSDTRDESGQLLSFEERRKIYHKRYYAQNKERICERTKERQAANREQSRAYSRAWYARNREAQRLRAEVKNRRTYGLPEPTRARPDNCECCGKTNGKRVLANDHCHETGVFRGWLCDSCNLGIGRLGDSIESLQKAIDYLKRALP
jgi:hypothetical protein